MLGMHWFKSFLLTLVFLLNIVPAAAQKKRKVPAVHSNIKVEGSKYYVDFNGKKIYQSSQVSGLNLENLKGNPRGIRSGLYFDFNLPGLKGIMYYGFIPYGDSKHPSPVYFPQTAEILDGKTSINIKDLMKGRYDMIGWQAKGKGSIGRNMQFLIVDPENLED